MADMNAILLLNERHVISEDAFAELVVWHLPSPVKGSRHVKCTTPEALLEDFWTEVDNWRY
jgi:hypothetical protein